MNKAKCKALKSRLGQWPPHEIIVPIEEFFDGNDDAGSIGCNLSDHPGIDAFREQLTGLVSRPDVEAVYARISELNPGDDSWPFTDTVFVVGSISSEILRELVEPLQPDEIGEASQFGVPSIITQQHKAPSQAIWWD